MHSSFLFERAQNWRILNPSIVSAEVDAGLQPVPEVSAKLRNKADMNEHADHTTRALSMRYDRHGCARLEPFFNLELARMAQ
ncbi:hypothetical protein [Agrobacterium sp.]|uniref:hypothetical protein n=1 Tax=Agrobacterium sp. TaxID=361 RepID=UPI002899ADE3|nr:hypothetical protein [Agrobacterium sp.]